MLKVIIGSASYTFCTEMIPKSTTTSGFFQNNKKNMAIFQLHNSLIMDYIDFFNCEELFSSRRIAKVVKDIVLLILCLLGKFACFFVVC